MDDRGFLAELRHRDVPMRAFSRHATQLIKCNAGRIRKDEQFHFATALSQSDNALCALALCALVLGNYLPMVRVLELSRAGLGLQGEWIANHSKRITSVSPGGPADRAGLRAGDVIRFDPNRDADWVMAGYRKMPEGFSGALAVRHGDGSTSVVGIVPESVAYLPTLNDRLALLARLTSLVVMTLIGVIMVWARPGLMTWSLCLRSLVDFLPASSLTTTLVSRHGPVSTPCTSCRR